MRITCLTIMHDLHLHHYSTLCRVCSERSQNIYISSFFFFRFLPHFLLFPNVSYVTTEYVTRENLRKLFYSVYIRAAPPSSRMYGYCVYIIHTSFINYSTPCRGLTILLLIPFFLPYYISSMDSTSLLYGIYDIKSGSRADIIELLPHSQVSVRHGRTAQALAIANKRGQVLTHCPNKQDI